jgi:hypothetical protein
MHGRCCRRWPLRRLLAAGRARGGGAKGSTPSARLHATELFAGPRARSPQCRWSNAYGRITEFLVDPRIQDARRHRLNAWCSISLLSVGSGAGSTVGCRFCARGNVAALFGTRQMELSQWRAKGLRTLLRKGMMQGWLGATCGSFG